MEMLEKMTATPPSKALDAHVLLRHGYTSATDPIQPCCASHESRAKAASLTSTFNQSVQLVAQLTSPGFSARRCWASAPKALRAVIVNELSPCKVAQMWFQPALYFRCAGAHLARMHCSHHESESGWIELLQANS